MRFLFLSQSRWMERFHCSSLIKIGLWLQLENLNFLDFNNTPFIFSGFEESQLLFGKVFQYKPRKQINKIFGDKNTKSDFSRRWNFEIWSHTSGIRGCYSCFWLRILILTYLFNFKKHSFKYDNKTFKLYSIFEFKDILFILIWCFQLIRRILLNFLSKFIKDSWIGN